MTSPFSTTLGSTVREHDVRMDVEIRITRGHLAPRQRRRSPDEPWVEVMEPEKELVAVLHHDPGQPFMLTLCPPREGRADFELPCEEWLQTLQEAMTRLG